MLLNKITTDPISSGLLAAGLLLLPSQMPFMAPLQVAVPLPLLLVALRRGHRAGWQAVGILMLCTLLINSSGLLFPVVIFTLFAGFPLLTAWLWRTGWKTSQCLTIAFLIGGVVLAGILLWAILTGSDLPAQLSAWMNIFKEELLSSLSTSKELDAATLAHFRRSVEQFIDIMSLLFPAFALIGWFFVQIGNLLFARFLIRRWKENGIMPEDLTMLRLPFPLIWAMIAMGLLSLLARGPLQHLGANMSLFLTVPYFFQGLTIIQQAFRKYNIKGIAQGVFFAALFFWAGITLLVTLLGLFDTWIDFRHRFLNHKEGNDPSGR